MTTRIRQPFSLALLALLSLLVSCSRAPGKPLVLGFSQVAAGANWDNANSESIRKAALDSGVELRL